MVLDDEGAWGLLAEASEREEGRRGTDSRCLGAV